MATLAKEDKVPVEALLNGHAAQREGLPRHHGVRERLKMDPWIIIPAWIGLSASLILFNKHIFSNLNFAYPVFLTDYHMLIATLGTRVLINYGPKQIRSSAKMDVPWNVYRWTIIPLSILFSASLILSNVAYVHLSVSFVQMLKAFIPILTLIIQLIFRLQEYNHLLLGVILMTCLGCSVAATGELRFSTFGFLCQAAAVVIESSRLVLIQLLLKDYDMDPLSSIAMYAPLCVVFISSFLPFSDGLTPFTQLGKVGAPLLILNGLVAFALNVAGVFLIDSAGSLVLTLSGVSKDVLLITFSVILGSRITLTQIIGYAIALCGLMLFRLTGGSPETPLGQKVARTFKRFTGQQHT